MSTFKKNKLRLFSLVSAKYLVRFILNAFKKKWKIFIKERNLPYLDCSNQPADMNIGRYMATKMVAMIPPSTTIIKGSIILVIPITSVSTSSSNT